MSELRLVPKAAVTPVVVKGWTLLHSCWDSIYDASMEPFFKELGQFYSLDSRRIQHQQVYLHGQSETWSSDSTAAGKRYGMQRVITMAKSTVHTNFPGKVIEQAYFEGDVEMPRPDNDPDKSHLCLGFPYSLGFPYAAWEGCHGWRNLAVVMRTFSLSPGRVSVGDFAREPCNAFGRVWVRDSSEKVTEEDLPTVDEPDVVVTVTAQQTQNGNVEMLLTLISGAELPSKVVKPDISLQNIATDLATSMDINEYRLKFGTCAGELLDRSAAAQSLILHEPLGSEAFFGVSLAKRSRMQ
jgi:hypothetical protein